MWCGGLPPGAGDDEQYREEQPREGLFLAGVMNCWEEFSHLSLSLSLSLYHPSTCRALGGDWAEPFATWVAGPIYSGPGPLPKY